MLLLSSAMLDFPEPILAKDREGRVHILSTTANASAFIVSVLPLPHTRWLELVIAIKALGAAEADHTVIKYASATLRDWLTAEGLLHDPDTATNCS